MRSGSLSQIWYTTGDGIGVGRSMSAGSMCPSYRVTKDEVHSTRGRANALRAALSGQVGPEGLYAEAVHQAMDLCLECKASRNECASKEDMAKLKYEFLAHYQAVHGVPLRKRVFAALPYADNLASKAPRLANRLNQNQVFKRLLVRGLKIDRRRQLPLQVGETFQAWFARRGDHFEGSQGSRGEVILWDDCHSSHHGPEICRAAAQVLEAAGFKVPLMEGRAPPAASRSRMA